MSARRGDGPRFWGGVDADLPAMVRTWCDAGPDTPEAPTTDVGPTERTCRWQGNGSWHRPCEGLAYARGHVRRTGHTVAVDRIVPHVLAGDPVPEAPGVRR